MVALAHPLPAYGGDEEAVLTVVLAVGRAQGWAERGFEVARVQLVLPSGRVAHHSIPVGSPRDASASAVPIPKLALWRAPTDNDGLKLADMQDLKPLGRWRAAGLDALDCLRTETRSRGAKTVVEFEWRGADPSLAITQRERWTRLPDGSVIVAEAIRIPDGIEDLPRIGMRWDLPPELDQVTWYGRGPVESYPDRRRGAHLGRFAQSVADQYVPYVVPQEHGGHADTRWGVVHGADGRGLLVTAAEPFQWNVSQFTPEELTAATHAEELEPSGTATTMHLDSRHRGLGTLSCGPDTLPEYRIGAGRYRFTWAMRTVNAKWDDLPAIARDLRAACLRLR